MTRLFLSRLAGVIAYFAIMIGVGIVGYILIEGWAFHDALYMTVITVTAVGYHEVGALSTAGRNFTMVLLGGGITGLGLWFALVTALLIELDLKGTLLRRRTMKGIEHLRDHVIVCGAGRTGRQVMEELQRSKQPFVLIENRPDRIRAILDDHPNVLILEGDATHDHQLEMSGIRRARGIITCLSADADNLFVCLSARALNRDLTVVARANETETSAKMYRAGASHVVSPNVSSAVYMASVLLRPSVVSFLDVATRSHELDLRLEQSNIGPDSPLAGKTLAEASIPQATGLIVIALMKDSKRDADVVFNPVGSTVLSPGDDMIVMGRPEQLEQLEQLMQ